MKKKKTNPVNVQAAKLPNLNTGTSRGLCWHSLPSDFAHVFLGLVLNAIFMSMHKK